MRAGGTTGFRDPPSGATRLRIDECGGHLTQCALRARVRAAFFAAAERPAAPLVRAAFFAAALRSACVRLEAAWCARRDSARFDAAE